MPSPDGPPQSQRWLDYIPQYIINGGSHADLMKIIPVRLHWARVLLSLLSSRRVCINTWLHAKGLSQTGFLEVLLPFPQLFFSFFSCDGSKQVLFQWEDSQKQGTHSEEGERGRFSRRGLLKRQFPFGDLQERLPWAHFTAVAPLPGCPSTPPPSGLHVYFVRMVTQAVSNPAGNAEDFRTYEIYRLSQHECSCTP